MMPSAITISGAWVMTRSSRAIVPSATSWSTITATNVLDRLPTRKGESGARAPSSGPAVPATAILRSSSSLAMATATPPRPSCAHSSRRPWTGSLDVGTSEGPGKQPVSRAAVNATVVIAVRRVVSGALVMVSPSRASRWSPRFRAVGVFVRPIGNSARWARDNLAGRGGAGVVSLSWAVRGVGERSVAESRDTERHLERLERRRGVRSGHHPTGGSGGGSSAAAVRCRASTAAGRPSGPAGTYHQAQLGHPTNGATSAAVVGQLRSSGRSGVKIDSMGSPKTSASLNARGRPGS